MCRDTYRGIIRITGITHIAYVQTRNDASKGRVYIYMSTYTGVHPESFLPSFISSQFSSSSAIACGTKSREGFRAPASGRCSHGISVRNAQLYSTDARGNAASLRTGAWMMGFEQMPFSLVNEFIKNK